MSRKFKNVVLVVLLALSLLSAVGCSTDDSNSFISMGEKAREALEGSPIDSNQ